VSHDPLPSADRLPSGPVAAGASRHVLVVAPAPVAAETLRRLLLGPDESTLRIDHLDSLDLVPAALVADAPDILAVDARMDPHDLVRVLAAAVRAEHHLAVVVLPAPLSAGGGTSPAPHPAPRPPRDMVEEVFRHALETSASRRALRASEARFTALADACELGVIVVDSHGLVRTFNPAAERLLGGCAAERVGRGFAAALPHLRGKDGRPLGEAEHPLALARWRVSSPAEVDVLARHDDGHDVRCVLRAHRLPAALECEDAPLLLLLRGVIDRAGPPRRPGTGDMRAHDLNNLLHTIRGHAELLALGVPPHDPAREHLESLHEAVDRAASLLRPSHGTPAAASSRGTPVDVDGFLTRSRPLLEHLLGDGIRLELDLALAAALVTIDPSGLEQAVMNLALNARDAMAGHGTLRIATDEVELDSASALRIPGARPGRFVRLIIDDDGCGMDAHVRKHAFDAGFTTRPQEGGSGLGLPSVRDFVERTGGFVTLESAPGAGSNFELYLPRESRG
jgi:two-component system, cell cycle sensor histidine kinase and response regulator CckA